MTLYRHIAMSVLEEVKYDVILEMIRSLSIAYSNIWRQSSVEVKHVQKWKMIFFITKKKNKERQQSAACLFESLLFNQVAWNDANLDIEAITLYWYCVIVDIQLAHSTFMQSYCSVYDIAVINGSFRILDTSKILCLYICIPNLKL